MIFLAVASLIFAAPPAYFYFRNVGVFRPLPPSAEGGRAAVSVLIPARDESANIAACVESVLASAADDDEVVVLDDHSEDDTAAIVERLADDDSRVRLVRGATLPAGWNGKQHACWQLSRAAGNETLLFLDADVRLSGDALPRLAATANGDGRAGLISGFPHQQTRSPLEWLLIPLISFVLLGFLSLRKLRSATDPGFAAGCGQLFITTKAAYEKAGGHAAIRASRHDGLKLPRKYVENGLAIDVFDATDLATVRMYRGAAATWRGLAKNADEGVANWPLILPVSIALLLGQVVPFAVLPWAFAAGGLLLAVAALAAVLAIAPRVDAAFRFRQPLIGAVLHPLGVLLFLAIQWTAFIASATGRQVAWKGRPVAASPEP
ncbi:MAG: glycosyltransferase [Planctomycetota bacterium]